MSECKPLVDGLGKPWSSEFIGEHYAITEPGSSGSPVFFHVDDMPLLGMHYWAGGQRGLFIRVNAIVNDILKQELILRLGDGYDASNSTHVDDASAIAASLAALQTQDMALRRLDELAPAGKREGLFSTTLNASTGIMQLHGDPACGGGLIELTSFTIHPESDPWEP